MITKKVVMVKSACADKLREFAARKFGGDLRSAVLEVIRSLSKDRRVLGVGCAVVTDCEKVIPNTALGRARCIYAIIRGEAYKLFADACAKMKGVGVNLERYGDDCFAEMVANVAVWDSVRVERRVA